VSFLTCGAAAVAAPQALTTAEAGYRVGFGDVIKVEAYQHDEISGEFAIDEKGNLNFPLLDEVCVGGLALVDVAHLLEQRLEKDFYVDVQLTVGVAQYGSQPVTVFGEVGSPGTKYLRGRTTLLQLLAEAGGLRESAGPVVELRRARPPGSDQSEDVYSFSTAKLASGEEGADVELAAGDVVSVSAKQLFFVTGEVARPGQYEIARGLTLMQAMSQAGGEGKFASGEVEIHREGADGKEILSFDLGRIGRGKAEDPPIKKGDVLIVKRRFF
jgi:polysaccharide export outer membrane protein